MSNLANTIKSEIARVARKELKGELLALRKATTAHRSEIAALKREIKALASALKSSARKPKTEEQAQPEAPKRGRKVRFSKERFAAKRAALGITQAQMAQLLEASSLSVHKWEAGTVEPRASQLVKIIQVLKLGKREAAAKLAA